jgi:ABC-type sugar transport system ATPase subunit
MTGSKQNPPILEMKGITKRFPGVVALDDVHFSLMKGEIHSIIGQNGAGKSTLMKILAGDYRPTQGEILIFGEPVEFNNQRESRERGISIVYQDLSLLPNLTVAENIFLGREHTKKQIIDEQKIFKETNLVLEQLGVENIDVKQRLGELPLAQQQLVEIAKALSYQPKILILDEPTAALAPKEAERLFKILLRLKKQNISIIYITHRLHEIINYCDRGTILRNGKFISTVEISRETTERDLIEWMIGQEIETFYRAPSGEIKNGVEDALLNVRDLSVNNRVHGVSFDLRKGEILGITGLLGAGQNELARALFGIHTNVTGSISRNGQKIHISSPRDAIRHGICLLTENRKDEGLFLDMSVKENITIPSLEQFVFSYSIPFINNKTEQAVADEFIHKVNIILRSQATPIRTLSGGNQQKAILARWLLRNLEILVFIEPTRGIDVGAKAEIYRYLDSLAGEGRGIIVVSPELIEILGISDRILVMHEGELVQEFMSKNATEELLMSAIQGASGKNK